jgi:type VI secretion system protein ImpE
MTTPYELYREGRLDEAIQAAIGSVKVAPQNIDGRLLLCDLLSVANQFERAEGHLDVILEQDSGLAAGIGLYRQLIRAEVARREVFQSGRTPEMVAGDSDTLPLHVRAAAALREGSGAEAGALLREAERVRPAVAGECDGTPFEELRDLDDVLAPCLEVLTSTGKYYWIAWERIHSLEFHPPKYVRDLLWRQTQMVIRDGPDAVVYVPVLYPGSHRSTDSGLRIGRKTEWVEGEGGVTTGVGQRTLLVGDEDKPILSIGRIAFVPGGSAARADV